MSVYVGTRDDGLDHVNAVLVQEADRIGEDIHRETVHTSPWIDMTPRGTFPTGMGYRLQALIYERALPTNAAQDTLGLTWGDFNDSALVTGQDPSAQVSGKSGLLNGSASDFTGPLNNATAGGAEVNPARIDWVKRLEPYQLKRATVWSPEINIEDLRFSAHTGDQLSAAFEALTEGVQYGWEERGRDEYQRLCNYVVEVVAATDIFTTSITGGDADDRFDNGVPVASMVNIGNAVLDKIYNRLVRSGGGKNAWGMENGRPVFAFICSSECSRKLQIETDYRTDLRESSRVDELLQPLGVSKSFRGFYHVIDDLAPRYDEASSDAGYTDGDYIRREPYSIDGSQLITPNDNYDNAKYEVAFVHHKEVLETLIPAPGPMSGPGGMNFDPQDYSGKFHWINIPHVQTNPLGSIGHYLGVLASASKPLKTKFGWAVIFDRTSSTFGGV